MKEKGMLKTIGTTFKSHQRTKTRDERKDSHYLTGKAVTEGGLLRLRQIILPLQTGSDNIHVGGGDNLSQ